jgi:hypothetical protein
MIDQLCLVALVLMLSGLCAQIALSEDRAEYRIRLSSGEEDLKDKDTTTEVSMAS